MRTRIVTPTMRTMTLIVAVVLVAVAMTMVTSGMSGLVRAVLVMMMTIVMTIALVVAPVVVMKRTSPTRIVPAVHGVVTKTRMKMTDRLALAAVTTKTMTEIETTDGRVIGHVMMIETAIVDVTGTVVVAPTGFVTVTSMRIDPEAG